MVVLELQRWYLHWGGGTDVYNWPKALGVWTSLEPGLEKSYEVGTGEQKQNFYWYTAAFFISAEEAEVLEATNSASDHVHPSGCVTTVMSPSLSLPPFLPSLG